MQLVENALRVRDALYTATVRNGFAEFGGGSRIMLPFRAGNAHRVAVGRDVLIGPSSWFMVPRLDAKATVIRLHDRVRMNQTSITAVQEVIVEEAVEMARGVYISDHMHGFDDPDLAIRDQPLVRVAPVRIGRGAWLGQNVVVMPGVTIGAGAVVGANSVVTRDVPPRTVAVGAPARVIRELVP